MLLTKHSHFQNILFSIGSSFLYYVNHFKLYSSFCASHSKAQKVLHPSKYFSIFFIVSTFHWAIKSYNLHQENVDSVSLSRYQYNENIGSKCVFAPLVIKANLNQIFSSDEGNQALQEFLLSCNPKQQHSTALESYLIKPIQRILKYPLLLTQLKVLLTRILMNCIPACRVQRK